MNLLDECKKNFDRYAAILGDYTKLSKNDLANGYCKACDEGDEGLRSAYYAALMLRYWFKIYKWKEDSASLNLEDEDFIGWLDDSLKVAFRYRAWASPYKYNYDKKEFILDDNGNKIPEPLYGDPNGADKSINQCCFSTRGREYQFYNKHKRKANVQTYSLDGGQEENGDSMLDYAGCTYEDNHFSGSRYLIEYYLNQNKGIEALILDGIAFQDVDKEVKTNVDYTYTDEETGEEVVEQITNTSSQFDARKLVKHLNSINQKFMQDYFAIEYDLSQEKVNNILLTLNKLKSANNTKLYKMIEKVKIEIRNNPQLLSALYK